VLRQLLTAAALVGLVVSSATAAGSLSATGGQTTQTTTVLMPGVTYTREVDFTPRGPVVLDIVTAPRPDGSLYTLAPVLSNDRLAGTEKLTGMEKRLSGGATVVGVNGDYYSPATGLPSGVLMRSGVLDSVPAAGRSSLGIGSDGTLSVARVAFKGTWQGSGQRRPVNVDALPAKGQVTLYTPSWGAATPAETGVVEDVFNSFPAARPGQPLTGTVTQVTNAGGTAIPPGGAVLVARGATLDGQLAAEAPSGRQVEVRLTLAPDWSGLTGAIGGGPLLVSGGKPVFNPREAFEAGVLTSRNARSAVGQTKDGRILLVTVEGAGPSYSVGMTAYELAVALARLGAVTAFGLGSGSSAELAFDGTLLTRASGGTERPLADALVLSYAGVYAAAPAADVLSPNGDGVDDTQTLSYKLVRPSKVTATLTGPRGATIPLSSDSEGAGTHTVPWNGTNTDGSPAAEGSWRFLVGATDDLGRSSTAERDFTLDETLGSLAVTPYSGPKSAVGTVAFRLTRPARVVATVERRNGIVVATLLRGTLGGGPHTVLWNGLIVGGRRAPNGAYQIQVSATSAIGQSSLVTPFTLPLRRRS
jgi:flagellar hook assembly protein FlgD